MCWKIVFQSVQARSRCLSVCKNSAVIFRRTCDAAMVTTRNLGRRISTRHPSLLGREIEVEWPADGLFYRAFVVDERRNEHLVVYPEKEWNVSCETLNLYRTGPGARKWRFVRPRAKCRCSHGCDCTRNDRFIGRRLLIHPLTGDMENPVQRERKTAFVLAKSKSSKCEHCVTDNCKTHYIVIFPQGRELEIVNLEIVDYVEL